MTKPRVRNDFPEFGFGSVSPVPGSDSDRFRRARFGFVSVSPGQVTVRIRIGFRKACGFNNLLLISIASGGHAFIINNNKLNASPGEMASAAG